MTTPIFHGTDKESTALLVALEHNCECVFSPDGVRTSTCGAHALLMDQRALNGLLFDRRIAARLNAEEMHG